MILSEREGQIGNVRLSEGLSITRLSTPLRNQFAQLWPTLLIGFTLGLLGILSVYVLSKIKEVPVSELTRDPSAVNDTPIYIGILSMFGLLLWAAAAAICLFSAVLTGRDARHRQAALFLFCSGLISLLLMLDDALLLHERVIPERLHIPEAGVFLSYVLIGLVYLMYFFRRILGSDYLLFLLALLFLGSSAAMDQFLPMSNLETFLEDSLKFTGIIFWLAYFAHTAARMLRDQFAVE